MILVYEVEESALCAQCTGRYLQKTESLETKVESLQLYAHNTGKSSSFRSHMRSWGKYDYGITTSYTVWREPWNIWICKMSEEFSLILPLLSSEILQILGLYLQSTSLKSKRHITPLVPQTYKVNTWYKCPHTINLHRIAVFAAYALRWDKGHKKKKHVQDCFLYMHNINV